VGFALRRDESIAEGTRRIAGRQLDKAIEALEQAEPDDVPAAVHGVRKRTKRVRAVARLVRSGTGEQYGTVNAAARDAARELSAVREGPALLETFDTLVAGAGPDRLAVDLLPVRQALTHRAETTPEVDLEKAIDLLTTARQAVDRWVFDDGEDVLARGLEKTYRHGRRGFRDALDAESPDEFHEWRKATKHLWHQTQLLEDAAPSSLHRQAHAFHDLADALGDDHDLAVLVGLVRGHVEHVGGPAVAEAAVSLAEDRRGDLERRALLLGARLYAEKPKAFVARMSRLRHAWIEHGDEEPTGEIQAIAPPEDGLDDRSRDELYALAREQELAGRSQMGRAELLANLRAIARR
jgi:CHAD domain-containing protein